MWGAEIYQDMHDLKEKLGKKGKLPEYCGMVEVAMSHIRGAQHFFCGEKVDLEAPFKGFTGKRIFMGEMAEGVRLPFKRCLFMYSFSDDQEDPKTAVPKRALIVIDLPSDLLFVQIFDYSRLLKKWVFGGNQYLISVGSPIGENPLGKQALAWGAQGQINGDPERFIELQNRLKSFIKSGQNIYPIPSGLTLKINKIEDCFKEDEKDLAVLNLTLLLLNCKNIVTEDNPPPPALNKKRRKAGKQELFTYKTLKLVLPSKARNGSEDQSPSGDRVRIHLCRGHFKHFTKDAPLFGRHTGLYWWQPQLRGDKTKGMVAKDYEVTAR